MRKTILSLVLFLASVAASAQTGTSEFKARYDRMVAKLGPCGVGVENLLDKWAQEDSSDVDLLIARFNYHFEKSRTYEVQQKPSRRYLGSEPLLSLKDSTGAPVYYYQVPVFDDTVFGKCMRSLDKALLLYPDRFDLMTRKAMALVSYEQESPLLSKDYLLGVISAYVPGKTRWTSPDVETIDDETFCSVVQEYCATYFTIATPEAMEALRQVSESMLSRFKNNTDFLVDMGSYHMTRKEYKKSLKYFDKVLKLKPDCYPAIRNCCVYAIQQKDEKLMKKYLPFMAKYGSPTESASAKARLDSLK